MQLSKQKQTSKMAFSLTNFFLRLNQYSSQLKIQQNVLASFTYTGNLEEQIVSQKFKIDIRTKKVNKVQKHLFKRKCDKKLNDKVYVCYDCRLHAHAFLCETCFYEAGHDIKCHTEIIELPSYLKSTFQCSCGAYEKIGYKGTCSQHHQEQQISKPQILVQDEAEKDFVKYYYDCWKMFISLTCIFLETRDLMTNDEIQKMRIALFTYYGKRLIQNFGQSSRSSLQLAQISLLSKTPINFLSKLKPLSHLKQETSVLGIVLQIIPCSIQTQLYDLIYRLLLLKSQIFVKDIVINIFNCTEMNGKFKKLEWLQKYRANFAIEPQFFCQILNNLAKNGKIAYEPGQQIEAIKFYSACSCPDLFFRREDKIQCSLIQCWRNLLQKQVLTFQNILKLPNYSLSSILFFTEFDSQLFTEVTKSLIKLIKQQYTQKSKKFKFGVKKRFCLEELCTILSELVLRHYQGDVNAGAKGLRILGLDDQLVKIIYTYLSNCLKDPAKLTYEILIVFGAYLNALERQDEAKYYQFVKLWKKEEQNAKVYEFMKKIFITLISEQIKCISKTSKYHSKKQENTEEIKQQKFKQFLYMKKSIPRSQINKLVRQHVLNFNDAAEILRNYTKYSMNTDTFVYDSEQIHFSYDEMLPKILQPVQQSSLLIFTPQIEDKMFSSEFRRNVLKALLTPLLYDRQRKVYINEENEINQCLKLTCLIFVDKILNGSIQSVRDYLCQTRDIVKKQNNRSSNQMKLKMFAFQIEKTKDTSSSSEQFEVEKDEEQKKDIILQTNLTKNPEGQEMLLQDQKQNKNQQEEAKIETIICPQQKPEKIKAAKYLKIAQKFKLKQQKVLKKNNLMETNQKQQANRQICMICKDQGSTNNALYFLGLLNKQTATNQIFKSKYQTQYTINLCRHVIHEKCYLDLSKGSVFQCPLCKIYSNIVFPCEGEHMTERSREFMDNRLTYTFIQSFNEYHYESSFILILKNLIAENLSYCIFNVIMGCSMPKRKHSIQKSQQEKKINYYLGFLKQWWSHMEDYQKQYVQIKVQKSLQINKSENMIEQKKKNPKQVLDEIILNIIWANICQKDLLSVISKQLDKLKEIMIENEFESLVKYLEKYCDLSQESKKTQIKTEQQISFIYHFFRPPQKLAELQHLCKSCKKCGRVARCWYCLQCEQSFCSSCCHEKSHGQIVATIDPQDGRFQYKGKNGNLNFERIYANSFMQIWSSEKQNTGNYFDYEVSNDMLRRLLYLSTNIKLKNKSF